MFGFGKKSSAPAPIAEPATTPPPVAAGGSWFSRLKQGLKKTSGSIGGLFGCSVKQCQSVAFMPHNQAEYIARSGEIGDLFICPARNTDDPVA